MTDLIDAVQVQEPADALVDLFELEIRGEIVRLYGGLDGAGQQIQFADEGGNLRDYFEFPVEVEGLDWSSDGAASRPTLRIANVLSLVGLMNDDTPSDVYDAEFLGITKNEDLIGCKLTRRRTMESNLGVAGTPVEFPQQVFIIDRVSAENNIVVEFELASPFDVEGVQIPARVVVGKYCPWKYQGATDATPSGACSWPQNSNNGTGARYYDIDNTLLTGISNWNISTSYSIGAVAKRNDFIYEAIRANTGKDPEKYYAYWKRIDLCAKTITACKIRFQDGDASVPLPFGGFPGSRKFK